MRQNSNRPGIGIVKSLALLFGSCALAAGCSTAPSKSKPPAALAEAEKPPQIRVDDFKPGNVEVPPEWLTIESTVVSLGEQDLFDRIRTGFGLEDVDHATVDREERWYARHPDYLDRTLRRGEPYLYYIVSELEAREMPRELALLPIALSIPPHYPGPRLRAFGSSFPAPARAMA